MPLRKEITVKTHGVPATFHRVDSVSVDLQQKSVIINVSSFFNEDSLRGGLMPIGFHNLFFDNTKPEDGENLKSFAERVLIQDRPNGAMSAADAAKMGSDRYMFEGAEIVD